MKYYFFILDLYIGLFILMFSYYYGYNNIHVNNIKIYENGAYVKDIDLTNINKNDLLYKDISKSYLQELLSNNYTLKNIDINFLSNGSLIISIKSLNPEYCIYYNNERFIFNNNFELMNIEEDAIDSIYGRLNIIYIDSSDFFEYKLIQKYVFDNYNALKNYCNFDKILSIHIPVNLNRIDINFSKLKKAAILADRIEYSCKYIEKFYNHIGDNIKNVYYVDLRIQNNLVFNNN